MAQNHADHRGRGGDEVDDVYVRITAMEMSDDQTRATFACCMPPAVAPSTSSPAPGRAMPG